MNPEVLSVAPMTAPVMMRLENQFQVHRFWEADDQEAFLKEIGPRVRALATNGALGASAALIDALPRLELIVSNGVGFDAIDLAAAKRRGIPITTTPDVLTEDVADMALALLLASARRIVQGDQFVRTDQWKKGQMPLTRRVNGGRAGIMGLGRVGRSLARRFESMNMIISYTARQKQNVKYTFYPSLETMASQVDFLIVAAAGGHSTRKIVNRAVLDALGPNGILINVSRGSVVDEPALVSALEEGTLGGAGLDVFATEPNVPEPLKRMPNVVLQPHHASGTVETREAMGNLVLKNLEAHFSGQPLLTPLNY
jgi:hydroxypyruvate reductase